MFGESGVELRPEQVRPAGAGQVSWPLEDIQLARRSLSEPGDLARSGRPKGSGKGAVRSSVSRGVEEPPRTHRRPRGSRARSRFREDLMDDEDHLLAQDMVYAEDLADRFLERDTRDTRRACRRGPGLDLPVGRGRPGPGT